MRNPFKKTSEIKFTRYQKRHRSVTHIIVDGKEVYLPYYVEKLAKMNHKRFPEISEKEFYDGIYKAYMKKGKTKDAVRAGERLIFKGLIKREKTLIRKLLFIFRFRYLVLKVWWTIKKYSKIKKWWADFKPKFFKKLKSSLQLR